MLRGFAMVLCVGLLAACGNEPATDAAPAEEAAPAPAEPAAAPEPVALPRTPSPEGAMVYIVSPADGDTVTSPVRVVFGLQGIGVAPAGIVMENTGHHHLLIDTQLQDMGLPIPTDEQNVHFGLGQTEAELELSPGAHTLQLVVGDHLHIPHDPPLMSEVITVEVQP